MEKEDEEQSLLCQYCSKPAVFHDRRGNGIICDSTECHEKHRQASPMLLNRPLNLANTVFANEKFRQVLHTNIFQIVAMSVPVDGAIGDENNTRPEIHPDTAQLIIVLAGTARVTRYYVGADPTRSDQMVRTSLLDSSNADSLVIEPNTYHYIENIGNEPLKLLTIYSSPQH